MRSAAHSPTVLPVVIYHVSADELPRYPDDEDAVLDGLAGREYLTAEFLALTEAWC